MAKIETSQLKPISKLPRNYKEYVTEAKNKGPVVFMTRSKPSVVLVDFNYWETLTDISQELEEKVALETIKKSEEEYTQGKAKKLRSLKNL